MSYVVSKVLLNNVPLTPVRRERAWLSCIHAPELAGVDRSLVDEATRLAELLMSSLAGNPSQIAISLSDMIMDEGDDPNYE